MSRRSMQDVRLSAGDVEDLSREYQLSVPLIMTVVEVESTGRGFWALDEYADIVPVINFEAQWFRRLTKGRYSLTHPGISFAAMDRLFGYGEWPRFTKASKLDRSAAIQATSWGLMQVMGFNFRLVGFEDPESFVEAMCRNEKEQLRAGLEFIRAKGLDDALRQEDWSQFALRYNGKSYRINEYDIKLAQAYERITQGGVR